MRPDDDQRRLSEAELAEVTPPCLSADGTIGGIDEAVESVMIVGGTFDPPHKGHVFLPMLARQMIERERGAIGSVFAVYVPAFVSPHKQGQRVRSAAHRMAMLHRAVQHLPRTSVWAEEIARGERTGEPSYTVDTLMRLRAWLDQRGRADVTLRLVIGADQLLKLHAWREPREIMRLARPVILLRAIDGQQPDLSQELARAGFWAEDEIAWLLKGVVKGGAMPYSSTAIREAIAEGREPQGLDPLVGEYIREQGLFQ